MSQAFAWASSGDQANRETPPPSAPIWAAASSSAASEDTAPLQPAIELDRTRDRERDPKRKQKPLPRLLFEGPAAEVAEHRRIAGPEEAGHHVEADEPVPGHLEQAAGQRHHRAAGRNEAAYEDQVAASLVDLLLGPVDPLTALSLEPPRNDPVARLSPDPVGRVVAQDRAGGRAEDDQPQHQVSGRGEDARENYGSLARDERDDHV